ncbi:MAG TPA: phosphoglycerate kinase, partial [Bacteroidales bacterium]
MKTIEQYNFTNKRVLVRVDFNVPLDDNLKITDTNRIDATLPTIRKILEGGGSAILMSHLGRPKSGPENKLSLRNILPYLSEKLGIPVLFAEDC